MKYYMENDIDEQVAYEEAYFEFSFEGLEEHGTIYSVVHNKFVPNPYYIDPVEEKLFEAELSLRFGLDELPEPYDFSYYDNNLLSLFDTESNLSFDEVESL